MESLFAEGCEENRVLICGIGKNYFAENESYGDEEESGGKCT